MKSALTVIYGLHRVYFPEAPVRVFTNRKNLMVVREDTNHGLENIIGE
jgi:hypothetical protein